MMEGLFNTLKTLKPNLCKSNPNCTESQVLFCYCCFLFFLLWLIARRSLIAFGSLTCLFMQPPASKPDNQCPQNSPWKTCYRSKQKSAKNQLDPYTPNVHMNTYPRAITSYEFQRMCEFYFC